MPYKTAIKSVGGLVMMEIVGSSRTRRSLLLLCSLICSASCFHASSSSHVISQQRRGHADWQVCTILSNAHDGEAASSAANDAPIRLNKVFKASHSRRAADRIIQEGRVTVNGEISRGCMVVPFRDTVMLDGTVVKGWEEMNAIDSNGAETGGEDALSDRFEYVKYWKPRGVICTTDRSIDGNIMDEIMHYGGYRPEHRVYPVGRLDKDSSGLILLTSDGRLPNASLRQNQKQPKVYQVWVDLPLKDNDLEHLRNGVVITTVAQRDGKSKPLTARTKPCSVNQLSATRCEITLTEGRNRQIRKMMGALGYTVTYLHRIRFGEISLDDVSREGEWKRLSQKEMEWIERILEGTQQER